MIIPTQTVRHVFKRQEALPTDFASSGGETTEEEVVSEPTTTRTTTLASPSATAGGILAQAKATTDLSWWQLLCIALGGVLLLSILFWAVWRTKRRRSQEKRRAKEVEEEESKRVKEILEQRRLAAARKENEKQRGKGRRGRDDDDSESGGGSGSSWTESEESYDSVSDGGTIVPRRRTRRKRRRERRRRYISSSEDSDWSDETRYERRRGRGSYDRERTRARERDRERKRDRRYRHRSVTPPLPSPKAKKGFRDSVFSTYASMKKAAVQLKYVEAKVKLKQQLEEEDKIEKKRQEAIRRKVDQANRDIQVQEAYTADSDRPLIPPAPHRQSSASSAITPTPPPRMARRGTSGDSVHTNPYRNQTGQVSQSQVPIPSQTQKPNQAKQFDQPSKPPQTGLGAEIQHLLGRKPQSSSRQPTQQPPPVQPAQPKIQPQTLQNAFQADWLGHPKSSDSFPVSPTHSVYLPITKPKDRPMIPPGGLAPAPPAKVRVKDGGLKNVAETSAASGAPGGKWGDRLRSRK